MEYGTWECPECEQEHSDPETATLTSCGKCGIAILLSVMNDDNLMTAIKANLNDYSLKSILAAAPTF